MIVRTYAVLATAFAIVVTAEANGQTFIAPAALGSSAEGRAERVVTLPTVLGVRQAAQAQVAADTAAPGRISAASVVVESTDASARIDAADASWLSAALARATRTARRRPRAFQEQLDLAVAYPNLGVPETDVGEAVLVAVLANDQTRFERVLQAANPEERLQLERRKNELLSRVAAAQSEQRTVARVFADGTIRGTAEGKESPEGVGTGALAIALDHGDKLWYAALTVASTEDTLSGNFGAALLAPGSGKALSSGLISVLYHDFLATGFGLHPYLSTSSHFWSINDTTRSATVLGLGVLFRRDLGTQDVGGKNVSLAAEIGPTSRFLGGDVLDLSESARDEKIGTSNTAFFGLESGATLSVGDLVGSIQLYYLFGKDEDRVLGLSNLQLVAGFSVKGELFRP
jgi:hypothetical protein